MRKTITALFTLSTLLLPACMNKGPNPDDPYEASNRAIYRVNNVLDKLFLKPPARLYNAITPAPVRAGINNFYLNINLIPSVVNDLLQTEWTYALKDTWRFIINSTLGLGGIGDPASSTCQLPPHSNDLGLTFAKWGDKKSPFIMIPLLGPSTIRDGMGLLFNYTLFSPYPYIPQDTIIYGLLGFRYIDLRAQMLDTEKLMDESLDPYAFLRDAYLQNRNFLITGETQDTSGMLYVDDEASNNPNPLTSTPSTPVVEPIILQKPPLKPMH
jgi:phospholipid-binding lipoprotein MlaA